MRLQLEKLLVRMVALSALLFLFGCEKSSEKRDHNDLLAAVHGEIVTYDAALNSLEDQFVPQTKASTAPVYETYTIPEWAQSIFDAYASSEGIEGWSTERACRLLSERQDLTSNQIEAIIQGLAAVSAFRNHLLAQELMGETKVSEEECLVLYKGKVKRILLGVVGATIAGACAGGIGALAGFIAGGSLAVKDIHEAGSDYIRCCA